MKKKKNVLIHLLSLKYWTIAESIIKSRFNEIDLMDMITFALCTHYQRTEAR